MEILVAFALDQKDKERISAAAPDAVIHFCEDIHTLPSEITDKIEIAFGYISPSFLPKLPKLKWIHAASAGYDQFLTAGTLRKDVILTNSSGAYGQNISEYMLGAVLMHMQNFHRLRDNQASASWTDEGLAVNILGSTVAVVGTGDIGSSFAERMKLLGASRVIGFKRNIHAKMPDFFDEIHTLEEIDTYLSEADVIATSLPSSPETTDFFHKERIALFKKGSIFVNVGRGTAVDLEALCTALDEGKVRGATVDVTDPEPLPSSHRAWHTKNLMITPHIAGGFRGYLYPNSDNCISLKNIISIFTQNLQCFLNETPLRNTIDHD